MGVITVRLLFHRPSCISNLTSPAYFHPISFQLPTFETIQISIVSPPHLLTSSDLFLSFHPPTHPLTSTLTGYPINARVAALESYSTSIQQQQTLLCLLAQPTTSSFCLFTQQSNSFTMKFLKLSSVVLALPFAIANPVKNVDFAHGQPSDGKLKGGPILGKS